LVTSILMLDSFPPQLIMVGILTTTGDEEGGCGVGQERG
jgi:hypothetical protein